MRDDSRLKGEQTIKMKCFLLVLAIGISAMSFPSSVAIAGVDPNFESLVTGNNEFAFDLYEKLVEAEANRGENIFLSPYSVSSALAMTWAGASGETAVQMEVALRFHLNREKTNKAFSDFDKLLADIQDKGDVELAVANSIWPQAGYALKENYVRLLKEYYGVAVTPVNYIQDSEGARKTINGWVEEKTREKIRNLIKPNVLTPLTRLVLVNAIYFKGTWLYPFDEEATTKAPFHLTEDAVVDVPVMYQEGHFRYGNHDGMQAVELPYSGDSLSMLVVLPEAGRRLEEIEKKLSSGKLQKLARVMKPRKVQVYLPRFEMTWGTHSLKEELQSLGMKLPFEAGLADFSVMAAEPGDLNISNVLHKAFVKVNEEGTEAAAATAVIVVTRSASSEEVALFRADRPFLFFIRENSTGAILFMGRCMNPK